MGKVVQRAYRPGPSAEKIVEASDRARFETRLQVSPGVIDNTEIRVGNYNFVLAVIQREFNRGKITLDAARDLMFKSRELFRLSYRQVYGRDPILPQVRADGKSH